jgi:hypothetical protein
MIMDACKVFGKVDVETFGGIRLHSVIFGDGITVLCVSSGGVCADAVVPLGDIKTFATELLRTITAYETAKIAEEKGSPVVVEAH